MDNLDLRRAMALSIDRNAFTDTLTQGRGEIARRVVWYHPNFLRELPGYGPDIQKSRSEARAIMEKLGYGPNHRLNLTISTRDLPAYRDPAYSTTIYLSALSF